MTVSEEDRRVGAFILRLHTEYGIDADEIAEFVTGLQRMTTKVIEREVAKPLPPQVRLLIEELLKMQPMRSE